VTGLSAGQEATGPISSPAADKTCIGADRLFRRAPAATSSPRTLVGF
jgi:hypothetical protein